MPSISSKSRKQALASVAMAALAVSGLAFAGGLVPGSESAVSAQSGGNSISAADKAQGAKAHPELLAEFGGAVSGAQANYVERVGRTIAMQSGLGNAREDFTVTLLDSPVNNAFAIPGGYVYVTRQLSALMNNEAELAGVLGHEVGHVAARHSARRQSAAQKNQLLGVLGSVLSNVLLGDSMLGQLGQRIASTGSQLLTLKYSRSQEQEADRLGITYLQRAGYDPGAMATVLESLARQNALDASLKGSSTQVPEWASSHPDPASRVRDARKQAGSLTGRREAETFLAGIDGLVYGDNPEQGVIENGRFVHPKLRFAFDAPEGFYMVNGTRAVTISGGSGKAQFSGGKLEGSLEAYISGVFSSLSESNSTSLRPSQIERVTVNGLPAAYGVVRTRSSSGEVDVAVFAYDFGKGQAYHFVTMTKAGGAGVFNPMFRSLTRIGAQEAGEVRPRVIDVVTVKSGDTPALLSQRMAFSQAQLERFLVLNGMRDGDTLKVGSKVKIVRYGT